MADNYLEKQYEQYEARKAAWEKNRKYVKKKSSTNSKAEQEVTTEKTTPADGETTKK